MRNNLTDRGLSDEEVYSQKLGQWFMGTLNLFMSASQHLFPLLRNIVEKGGLLILSKRGVALPIPSREMRGQPRAINLPKSSKNIWQACKSGTQQTLLESPTPDGT
jgi:hypothetical protein